MKNITRIFFVIVVFMVMTAGVCFAAEEVPVLIAASATSYSEGSSPITCLLDPDCAGYWSPKSGDAGINEGIYMQFKDTVKLDYIQVIMEGNVENTVSIKAYLDGKTITKMPEFQGDMEARGIGARAYPGDKITSFMIGGDYDAKTPLRYKAKSVFIKIIKDFGENRVVPKVKNIIILREPKSSAINIKLPVSVKADVSATSTLSPFFAYDVSHLFDSQMDMAWSTDGKKTDGLGQKISLKFERECEIGGVMVWNGYQRSSTHYTANSRVKIMEIEGQKIALKDVEGAQAVMFEKPINKKSITLSIKDIYKGSKYKDTLISELRLLSPSGKVILPRVKPPIIKVPEFVSGLVDNTYSAFIHNVSAVSDPDMVETGDGQGNCAESSIRIRSNGTFVIYRDESYSESQIMEGNWEISGDNTIRLFGKKYEAPMESNSSGYLMSTAGNDIPETRIFQSKMTIKRYNQMTQDEKDSIVNFLLKSRTSDSDADAVGVGIFTTLIGKARYASLTYCGKSLKQAKKKLKDKLELINPFYVKSDVYTDLIIPIGEVNICVIEVMG